MQTRQEKIIEIAQRNARGDLTPTQLEWWCYKLNTNIEEINKIYEDYAVQSVGKLFKGILLWFAFITSIILFVYNF